MATAKQPTAPSTPHSPPRPVDLSQLVQKATSATLVTARRGSSKSTHTLELVRDRESHGIPCLISQVPEIQADVRRSARKLDMGVNTQVQDLDGEKITGEDVKDLIEQVPDVSVLFVFQGADKRVVERKPKDDQ